MAVTVAAHPQLVDLPVLRRLVEVVGKVDAHGPAHRLVGVDAGLLAAVAAAVDPIVDDDADLAGALVAAVDAVVDLVVAGGPPGGRFPVGPPGGRVPVGAVGESFEVVHSGDGWVLVVADGSVFGRVYDEAAPRAVLARRQGDGSWAYTVAKRSDFVDGFDVPAILAALSAVEPGWGGGSTVGGGGGAARHPDGSRSRLSPAEVAAVVDRVVV